jgi:hypothetical protein
MVLDVELRKLAISPTFQRKPSGTRIEVMAFWGFTIFGNVCRESPGLFLRRRNRMVHFIRALILVLSTATVSLAASSWSFSDATIAVGPKGKDATSLQT